MNLVDQEEIDLKIKLDEINQIKIAKSYNDIFFVCILNDENPFCIIKK